MMKNIKIKNEKGISLTSVVVTVVVMIIILTSIIYSNARTKEIKKAMLINSDIEELTKKVELYYLEKNTLPIDETERLSYTDKIEDPNDSNKEISTTYYRLVVSSLDNITLNNKEELEKQWYVINKQTHNIYFVINKSIGPEVQNGKYSEKYNDIMQLATTNGIRLNESNSEEENISIGNTTIAPGEDELIEDEASIGIGQLEGEPGNIVGPNIVEPEGNGVYNYVGYDAANNWYNPGDASNSLVLHYDGIMNTLDSSKKTYGHSSTTSTWSDMSGHNNRCNFLENSFSYIYSRKGSTSVSMDYVTIDTYKLIFNSNAADNSINTAKYDIWSKSAARTMNFNNKSLNLNVTGGIYAKPNLSLNDNTSYTIEMVFNIDNAINNKIYLYDFYYLNTNIVRGTADDNVTYNTKNTMDYYNKGALFYESIAISTTQGYGPLNFWNQSKNGNSSILQNAGITVGGKEMYDRWYTGISSKNRDAARGTRNTFINNVNNLLKSNNYKRRAYIDLNNDKLIIEEGTATYEFDGSEGRRGDPAKISNWGDGMHSITIEYKADSKSIAVFIDGEDMNYNDSVQYEEKEMKAIYYSNSIGLFSKDVYADVLYVDHIGNSGENRGSNILLGKWYDGAINESNTLLYRCRYTNVSTNNFYAVRIYNEALSQDEITHNYNLDKVRFGM